MVGGGEVSCTTCTWNWHAPVDPSGVATSSCTVVVPTGNADPDASPAVVRTVDPGGMPAGEPYVTTADDVPAGACTVCDAGHDSGSEHSGGMRPTLHAQVNGAATDTPARHVPCPEHGAGVVGHADGTAVAHAGPTKPGLQTHENIDPPLPGRHAPIPHGVPVVGHASCAGVAHVGPVHAVDEQAQHHVLPVQIPVPAAAGVPWPLQSAGVEVGGVAPSGKLQAVEVKPASHTHFTGSAVVAPLLHVPCPEQSAEARPGWRQTEVTGCSADETQRKPPAADRSATHTVPTPHTAEPHGLVGQQATPVAEDGEHTVPAGHEVVVHGEATGA